MVTTKDCNLTAGLVRKICLFFVCPSYQQHSNAVHLQKDNNQGKAEMVQKNAKEYRTAEPTWPYEAATCSGVLPTEFCAFISAPYRISSSPCLMWPYLATCKHTQHTTYMKNGSCSREGDTRTHTTTHTLIGKHICPVAES